MNESSLQNLIRIRLSKLGVMNFRNNTGMGWAGKAVKIYSTGPVIAQRGDVLVKQARPLKAGLCEGSSDIIGIKTVVITPEMVGKSVGIIVAAEVKTPNGRIRDKQKIFINNISKAGGIAGIVRSEDEVEGLVNK